MEFTCIWYDMEKEIKREVVDARDSEEASAIVNSKYNGHPPAPCLSITANKGSNDVCGFFQTRW